MLMCPLLLWIGSWLISRPNTEAPSWHQSPGRPDSHCWWIGYTEPFHHRGSTHCLHRNRYIFQIWICFSHLQCFCQHHHVDSQDARFIPMVSHLKLLASEELSWVERKCGNRLIPTEIHWFLSHVPPPRNNWLERMVTLSAEGCYGATACKFRVLSDRN